MARWFHNDCVGTKIQPEKKKLLDRSWENSLKRSAMGSICFRSFRRLTIGGTLFLALIVSMSSARAFTFTINPALSNLTLSGSIAGTAFGQQGAGSLVTNYTGTIDSSFTGSTITFNSAAASANISGVWQPLPGGTTGSAPADYGVTASPFGILVLGAIRNLEFSLSSAGPITLTGNSFDATQISFLILSGDLDYNSSVGSGTFSLIGSSGANAASAGSLSIVAGVATLSIPVSYTQTSTVGGLPVIAAFNGTLVATAIVPESSTANLLIVGALLLVGWQVRRRASRIFRRA